MPIVKLYSINGSAGASTDISYLIPARYVEMCEDASGGPAQGLTYQRQDESPTPFTTVFKTGLTDVVKVGHKSMEGNACGPVMGIPQQQTPPSAWASTTTYKTGDVVVYSNLNYYSLIDGNISTTTPDSNTTGWKKYTQFNYRATDYVFKGVKSSSTSATKMRVTFYE